MLGSTNSFAFQRFAISVQTYLASSETVGNNEGQLQEVCDYTWRVHALKTHLPCTLTHRNRKQKMLNFFVELRERPFLC